MNTKNLNVWHQLPDTDKRDIFNEVSADANLPPAAVEKDWWVVRTLDLVFDTSIAEHTVFKGGTSLSKAWNLINRFSEDIDLALDRRFLGFNKPMTGSQVSKLRKHSFRFISEDFFPEISSKFKDAGFDNVTIKLGKVTDTDQDPLIIEIYYPTLTEPIEYLQPRVLIELGSRSLIEPNSPKSFSSMVGEYFRDRDFSDDEITIPTVNPERTFLEKIFLLHEEFQLPVDRMKISRKSRHLYDLERLMDTDFADLALRNKELYDSIVEHRRTLTRIRGIDYANHSPQKINIIPPDEMIGKWEKDYVEMQQSMLYNPSLPFDELIQRIKELKSRINNLNI